MDPMTRPPLWSSSPISLSSLNKVTKGSSASLFLKSTTLRSEERRRKKGNISNDDNTQFDKTDKGVN